MYASGPYPGTTIPMPQSDVMCRRIFSGHKERLGFPGFQRPHPPSVRLPHLMLSRQARSQGTTPRRAPTRQSCNREMPPFQGHAQLMRPGGVLHAAGGRAGGRGAEGCSIHGVDPPALGPMAPFCSGPRGPQAGEESCHKVGGGGREVVPGRRSLWRNSLLGRGHCG